MIQPSPVAPLPPTLTLPMDPTIRFPIDVTEGVPFEPLAFNPNDPPIKVEPFDGDKMVMAPPSRLPHFTPRQQLNVPSSMELGQKELIVDSELPTKVPPTPPGLPSTQEPCRSQRLRSQRQQNPEEGYNIRSVGSMLAHELLAHSKRVCYTAAYSKRLILNISCSFFRTGMEVSKKEFSHMTCSPSKRRKDPILTCLCTIKR